MYIYEIVNTANGDKYIGQTISNIEYRFRKHRELAGRGGGYKLHNAIRKYGEENFTISILDTAVSEQELNEKEEYYIDKERPYYNILPGGAIRLSPESIEKMRKSLTGKKQSQETIDKRFRKVRELQKDPQFLKERGKAISSAKKKTYLIEGEYFIGAAVIGEKYGITYGGVSRRVRSKSPKWKNWNIVL